MRDNYCIGLTSDGRKDGEEAHYNLDRRKVVYHNVWAGPFCIYHRAIFQNKLITELNESKGHIVYELVKVPRR